MTKEKTYKMLVALNSSMEIPKDYFGFERRELNGVLEQLQNEGYIAGAIFQKGNLRKPPLRAGLEKAYVTKIGQQFIEEYENNKEIIDLTKEFISACTKISDNPVTYASFDEDGLNRMIRDILQSSLCHFNYSVSDQTQQGISNSKPGELDIRICQNGIPVAIYEGLIHSSKQYLHDHIRKAISKYNQSGCKNVYIVEFCKSTEYSEFWKKSHKNLEDFDDIHSICEVKTNLLGVKLQRGKFNWHNDEGDFYYIGVNCNPEQ